MKKLAINDDDREKTVLNVESLYDQYGQWKRANKGGLRGFVREHRDTIDKIIRGEKG